MGEVAAVIEEDPYELLDIRNLSVRFGAADAIRVVDGLDLSVDKGEVLAIVGESGSGKSVTDSIGADGPDRRSGIVRPTACASTATTCSPSRRRQRRKVMGKDLAMVFQEPMTALNPSYTVGYQIEEVLRQHLGLKG